jgi:hypothetical protein
LNQLKLRELQSVEEEELKLAPKRKPKF